MLCIVDVYRLSLSKGFQNNQDSLKMEIQSAFTFKVLSIEH